MLFDLLDSTSNFPLAHIYVMVMSLINGSVSIMFIVPQHISVQSVFRVGEGKDALSFNWHSFFSICDWYFYMHILCIRNKARTHYASLFSFNTHEFIVICYFYNLCSNPFLRLTLEYTWTNRSQKCVIYVWNIKKKSWYFCSNFYAVLQTFWNEMSHAKISQRSIYIFLANSWNCLGCVVIRLMTSKCISLLLPYIRFCNAWKPV